MPDRFLTFLNSSTIQNLEWTSELQLMLIIEQICICLTFIQYLFNFYLLIKFRVMHRNLHILLFIYGGQYFLSISARSILIYLQYYNLENTELGRIANYCRTICVFLVLGMLPFLVFERCFATCLAGTYENNKHIWIPALLISIMIPYSTLSAMAYIRRWYPIYIHCINIICFNIGSSLLLIVLEKCNFRHHRNYTPRHPSYSLSTRFQISENIKTCQWLSRIQTHILCFNIACCCLLSLEFTSVSQKVIVAANVAFNFTFILYAAIVPCFIIYCTPEWSRETKRLFYLLTSRKSGFNQNLPQSTFGRELVYEKHVEAQMYFDFLAKDLRNCVSEAVFL
ncbi:unnamed protein product [Caenorhabditis angaria]|uniref:Uncharacterized protein n=1 Tax=Caenorhabditis angaria TaxID=860376 RepID=A0A9P1IV01_9PELO|nr:unnamed protein product [Caenorhabditis angaria]